MFIFTLYSLGRNDLFKKTVSITLCSRDPAKKTDARTRNRSAKGPCNVPLRLS